jgi:hypothetical protein
MTTYACSRYRSGWKCRRSPRRREAEIVADVIAEMEAQLIELGRQNGRISYENTRLQRELVAANVRLGGMRRLEEELADARAAVADLEGAEDALVREIQRLEALVRRR